MTLHEVVDILSQLNIKDISIGEPLKNHTSIKIGGNAKLFVKISTKKQLKDCINFFNEIGYHYYILGNGTNTLASDDGFDGAVVSLGKTLTRHKFDEDGIFVEAGMGLFELNKLCRNAGLSGLEFSYGIPGSVGGAICMNAGSFGHNIGEFVQYVLVLKNGKLKKLTATEMDFSYRHSAVSSQNFIVVGAKFKLKKGEPKQIEKLQNEFFQKKLDMQPYSELSFGSVFKKKFGFEPISKIIDDLGLKGYSVGGAKISEKHAGFVVNSHNATCNDCINLIQYVKKQIYLKYGFEPELEVKLLGGDFDATLR
jgi:UDP-N-acetylmuramate dehydrogenase